jgi:hypothetical protein
MSCKTSFNVRTYQFQPYVDNIDDINEVIKKITESDTKSIILKNDSVLVFWKRFGGTGSAITVKYIIINNELITDSVNLNGYEIPSMTNMRFLYSRDSLVNKMTNERYYTQEYFDKIYKK